MDTIYVRGARTHNLKNIDLDIPRDKLIVITGLSGSGKSSLAFDTLYAEGQRRYVESLSTYARQFLSMMEKPDVDTVEGLSPAISIEQKSTSHNPRSTVGTITEIYDYLRLLFARVGEPRCPDHHEPLQAQTVSQMVDQVLALPEGSKIMLLAPVIRDRKGEHLHVFEQLRRDGFVRARIDGTVCDLDDTPKLDKRKKHTIEVVVDRFKVRDDLQLRLAESFETALNLTDGIASISFMDGDQEDRLFSARHACPVCDYSLDELEPRLFSFNNPAGACPACDGLGVKQFFDEDKVILDAESSISEGAIRGWDRRNIYYYHMLDSLAEHYDFDLDKPWKKLRKRDREVILHGSGDTPIDFSYVNDRGDVTIRRHTFEGIIPNFQRRYRDTESQSVREELAKYLSTQKCPDCSGTRLRREARNVFVDNRTLSQITELPVGDAFEYFANQLKFKGAQKEIADKILKELRDRFRFLVDVGLNYLTLNRSAETLSGGEAQRIRLASQIGAGLVGVMYILDEPSIGLHQRDNERLLNTLTHLRDIGNTVIVVEHDEDAIRAADFIVDIGPGAGVHGGEVVAAGTHEEIAACERSLTGQYLSGVKEIAIPKKRNPATGEVLRIKGATGNNLKNVDLEIPVGLFTCVTGVSGSGKSTLINTTLYPLAATALNKATTLKASAHKDIEGLGHFDKCVDIDQSPIGRTPRSNPATYTGIFTPIRELFSGTQEARSRGYKPGRFSFNVKGGRCEACQGDGVIKVEMHFLPDIYVPCDTCKGKRYNRETLEVHYKGKNIHEVLEMTVEDAREFFDPVPSIAKKLQTLMDVGLSYIKLGQAATTLSGGEAQRVKLSRELSKRDTGQTLYILDEPTTGLHFADIQLLLDVLHRLRDHGNTIVVIEHNLDVIKTADWIVDLGPEGGSGGGEIIATGTPEQVAKVKGSHTGRFLKSMLKAR
ncbi:excinuclease ABC subunit UvrA [Microbulbifer hydrolyticus]|uniref:UvrABC system protein A n=1 Tax=Microbulbifer hydrolyticus TaxID=48074 RepID=A0A6P1TDJ3_9GAMM|nr:excinuclease ABC subunit UvrA [Microbulbifer hydrolyticus]MBB5212459.1 excinuclease ABC subunit A [Microbulbifer hydrolyticus]QHQ40087.1 excinuclease ABC subunit UvrA [Microbulbifer hydrolyticus]